MHFALPFSVCFWDKLVLSGLLGLYFYKLTIDKQAQNDGRARWEKVILLAVIWPNVHAAGLKWIFSMCGKSFHAAYACQIGNPKGFYRDDNKLCMYASV